MRKFTALCLTLAFLGLDAGFATAQEAHPTVTLTGCLAQDDDDEEVEYELEGVDGDAVGTDEVELSAGEGVDLAAHVGHRVEATGMVIGGDLGMDHDADDEAAGADDEAYDGEGDEEEDAYVYVTKLSHVAASCESG